MILDNYVYNIMISYGLYLNYLILWSWFYF